MAYFYTENMTVGYNGHPLISEIEMAVKRGEILTLIGPNGAGKSTILKSITGQLKLLGGCVYLDEKNRMEYSARDLARRQAVVLTQRISSEWMTCEDVVATGRYPYTGALGLLGEDDHKKIEEAMELVHAQDLKDRMFEAISDGQRQRILLARAICQEPELIVLDEPTSFLDIRHKLEFLEILRKMVREQQIAVIMSLHELDLAQKISDHVVCVKGDRISKYGTPEEVFTDEYIRFLYDMQEGSFDSAFGCMELRTPEGEPEVFVIAGGGSGIPIFRSLVRAGIPFAAGVLQENDIDCHLARHLGARVIAEEAFCPISDGKLQEALQILKTCREVYIPLSAIKGINSRNRILIEEAQKSGKQIHCTNL